MPIGGYWWLLVAILLIAITNYSIGGYFKLNYCRLLMIINGTILLTIIDGYFIVDIGVLFLVKLLVVIILVDINGY
jgi:hypothetical protein